MLLKTHILVWLLLGFLCTCPTQARVVTVTLATADNSFATNSVTVGANESAEIVSYALSYCDLCVYKNGIRFGLGTSSTKFTVAGPATIRLEAYAVPPFGGGKRGLVTVNVTPEAFAPDKTLIIPESTPGIEVTLEMSTDLLQWSAATNGVYSGTNGAKFFRIRADRIP